MYARVRSLLARAPHERVRVRARACGRATLGACGAASGAMAAAARPLGAARAAATEIAACRVLGPCRAAARGRRAAQRGVAARAAAVAVEGEGERDGGGGGGGGGGSGASAGGGGAVDIVAQLARRGVQLSPSHRTGEWTRAVCPACEGGSTGERSLAVYVDDGGAHYHCFRASCGHKGTIGAPSASGERSGSDGGAQSSGTEVDVDAAERRRAEAARPQPSLLPLNEKALAFFASRHISEATLREAGVAMERVYSPPAGEHVRAIAFPYYYDGEIVNIKYRGPQKTFWQVKGALKVLYGMEGVNPEDDSEPLVIVEGEMDRLALIEAGVRGAVSVPDGAPPKAKGGALPPRERDTKYEYLWNCRQVLDTRKRIVLATDADGPGRALAEELERRVGRERCSRVRWPEGCKDANDVLVAHGPDALRSLIDEAKPTPIRGLFDFSAFSDEIDDYYNLEVGEEERGISTGWSALDDIYKVVPGELTVITGVPNSGKSEWLDALCVNLCLSQGWSVAMCSMENRVPDHARKLLEKAVGRTFFEPARPRPGGGPGRMSAGELELGKQWLNEHIYLIRCEDDVLPSVDWVLQLARAAVFRHAVRGLVIDPYNELSHQRPSSMTETEYVSQMLTKVKRFAQHNKVHVWFVAHPRQMHNYAGEPPSMYDIAGSAHFINKADNGLVVHRVPDSNEVQILVRKVRNKNAGTQGEASLYYSHATGTYSDNPDMSKSIDQILGAEGNVGAGIEGLGGGRRRANGGRVNGDGSDSGGGGSAPEQVPPLPAEFLPPS